MADVFVTVLNWNAWSETIECLESVSTLEHTSYRLVVVDNGSTNDSAEQLIRRLTETRQVFQYTKEEAEAGGRIADEAVMLGLTSTSYSVVIRIAANEGFTGGCNVGLAYARARRCPYTWLLSNDVRVEPQTLNTLTRISKSEDAALVGPQVFDSSGNRPLFCGKTWPGLLFGGGFISGANQSAESWDSAYAEGCAFLLRNDLIERRAQEHGKVLNPDLFMYCEDTDLGLYARSIAFKCRIARDAHVRHGHAKSHGGDGNPFSHYYITRNRIQLAKKWLPWRWRMLFHFYYAPTRLLLWLSRLGRRRLGSWEAGRAACAGIWDGYRNHLGRWKRD